MIFEMGFEERSVPGAGRRAWGPRLLILAGIALLVGTVAWFAILAPLRNPKPLPIPGQLAGLPLTRHTFGRPAADEIARLHDGSTGSPRSSRFPLTGATVAEYADSAAIVWASQTWGRWGARYMTRSMTRAIERKTTPFTSTGQRVVDGHTVYALRGMGMSHFYFQAGDQVIWLAASPSHAEEAPRDLLQRTGNIPTAPSSASGTGSHQTARDFPARVSDAGRVVIEVTPLNLDQPEGTLHFQVAMNTHSVELNYDLTRLAVLRTDRGDEVTPLQWDGSEGGHHVNGTLYFPAIDLQDSQWVELVIREVAGEPERTFRWELTP